MTLKIILPFFFFVYLLRYLINVRLHTTLMSSYRGIGNFVIEFLNGHKVLDVLNVCCCCFCCLFLLLVLTRFLNDGRSHQSKAAFFTPLSCLLWRRSFYSFADFFRKLLEFLGIF